MGRRLLWMVGLYVAGIAVVGAAALVLRLLMTAAGLTA
jgi:hypothetical protein